MRFEPKEGTWSSVRCTVLIGGRQLKDCLLDDLAAVKRASDKEMTGLRAILDEFAQSKE